LVTWSKVITKDSSGAYSTGHRLPDGPIVLAQPDDFTLAALEVIAFDGARVELAPALLERVAAGRRAVEAALADGAPVYGVNTGMGYLAGVDLGPDEQATHQRNLLLGRAAGSAPWLEVDEVRALLCARLAGFVSGEAGVSAALVRFLADRLNDGFHPAIPRTGVGTAGEVIPLAHAFQTFVGVGAVRADDGALVEAATALAQRGVAAYAPGPKEGIALLAGAPGALGLAVVRQRSGQRLAARLRLGAACAIDALCAPLAPYSERVARLSGDELLAATLADLRALLDGAAPVRRQRQAPVSFRVAPQVLTHVARALDRLREDAARSLAACPDSPTLVDGAFVSTGAFHDVEVAAALDTTAAAFVRAGELSAQRVARLLDARFSGLPDQLTPVPGPRAGLVALHKRAVGVVHELRRLAAPASVGATDTSSGQEDAQTFGFAAAEQLRRVELLTAEVVAIELIAARQAWHLRDEPPARGLAETAQRLGALVAPVEADRALGRDVDAVVAALDAGDLDPP
jgi:histidine ammonia-lyase